MSTRQSLTGWGGTAPSVACVVEPDDAEGVAAAVAAGRDGRAGRGGRGVVVRGLGRSYGDAAQNAGGTVVSLRGLQRVLSVDVEGAVVAVEAGVSLDHLMRTMLPLGLFVPVTPGTRHVTVGGAIAADIHGKDHHVRGSFSRHVADLDLLLADGTVRRLTPERDPDLFWATVGGMGLTGVILRATLRMLPVETSSVVVDTERATDLDDLMVRMTQDDDRYTYSVAWVDCLARGGALGRSVLTRGWPARRDQLPARAQGSALRFGPRRPPAVPLTAPVPLVNRASVLALNETWFRKAPRTRTRDVQGIAPFFHPLDVLESWPRVYGGRGFVQYQFVVPFEAGDVVRRCLEVLHRHGVVVSLAVLKRFGPGSPAPLSFPMPGWTLAMDLPVVPGLGDVLDRLDGLVLGAGGRLYLAKDARLAPDDLPRMYPMLDRWRQVRRSVDPDGVFASDLSRRLGL
ncbi:FAD-binding oxidoreductase [Cellulomonas aerilata]|uniref:Oxidoreductase n=1 Tax=Cellulomonas aerilata TaxID=515326 RepID=A0A512D8T6_9CELL|nr:FAD-binding oxidoreductase [Cellulomonas aerilata]GEO32815.1 oxidoreductase [Cellulomonas aerilata]